MLGDDFRLYKHTPAWSLAKAVEDEDTTEISKQVLQMHISVDYRDPEYKQTLLMLATRTNKIESVKKLLELGANPNAHNDSTKYFGQSAVLLACRFTRPSSKILALLLKYGGNPNSTACGVQENGLGEIVPIRDFALSAAVFSSFEKVKLLVDAGANINYATSTENCAIENCMIFDRMDIMLYLLQKGADYRRKFTEIDLDKPDYPTFEVDILYKLRKCVYPIGSKEYTDKMKVVNFLKKKGLDYWKSPIPSGMYGVIMRDIAPKNKADFDYYIKHY
ncbi:MULTISPECIES: ankyrin repeat domain-containing protein [Bacteroidales]|jgi:ankyrin repeat protein|nr:MULTISPECIES: ankyrin repeat domain-containing protein [Bacteroidales]